MKFPFNIPLGAMDLETELKKITNGGAFNTDTNEYHMRGRLKLRKCDW
jgi:hypothetical protein